MAAGKSSTGNGETDSAAAQVGAPVKAARTTRRSAGGPTSKRTSRQEQTRAALARAATAGRPARDVSVGTDAEFAPGAAAPTVLRTISEVRHALRTNITPIVFVGATPFNLLGLDRWVRNFSYVTYYDGWDGAHPRVFTPRVKPYVEFDSGEAINNWLLQNHEVRAHIAARTPDGHRPKVAMVFFDEETERICADAGYDLILPSAELRHRLDSKLVTTRMAEEVGVPSVPNVIATVEDWATLHHIAAEAGLGEDLVIQAAYGDSGKTTFFVDGPEAFAACAEHLVGGEVKIMRRIENRPVAVEAVLTSSGTVVGPFMSELTGHSELTPYRGGWCGNEMFPAVLSDAARARATTLVQRLGARLGREGYRGFFEVDVLVDTTDDEVYLGELNPRISGASAITNVTAGAYADVPLFLFHLLEYLDVTVEIDVDEVNERWQRLAAVDEWSQMVVKETAGGVELIDTAAATGQYVLRPDGALEFRRAALDWHQLQDESEAFFLRIYGTGDHRWKGADLGVIVTKGRLQHEVGGRVELTQRARRLVDAVRSQYSGTPVDEAPLAVTAVK